MLSITSEIYEAFENYDEVRAVFLDISKAFDKVWHKGLVYKLKRCGINGKLIVLIENYLSNRVQRVVLNGQESEWEKINSGVPQGSVLGPLLFLIYINDLTDGISSNMKLFADDSSLFSRVQNVNATHEQLVTDLNIITEWAYQWKMKFNPDITKQAIEVIFSFKYKKRLTLHYVLMAFRLSTFVRNASIVYKKTSFLQANKRKRELFLRVNRNREVFVGLLHVRYKGK